MLLEIWLLETSSLDELLLEVFSVEVLVCDVVTDELEDIDDIRLTSFLQAVPSASIIQTHLPSRIRIPSLYPRAQA